jgi:hypothetical protein
MTATVRKRERPKAKMVRFKGYDDKEFLVEITAADVEMLAGLCGRSDEASRDELHELLRGEARGIAMAQYFRCNDVRETSQRVAIGKLLRALQRVEKAFVALDDASLATIKGAYPPTGEDAEPGTPEYEGSAAMMRADRDHLQRLHFSVAAALNKLNPKRGNPGNGLIDFVCWKLATLYERFSGKDFTFDREWTPGANDPFLTDGARFVHHAGRLFVPDGPHKFTTAMKGLGKRLRDQELATMTRS